MNSLDKKYVVAVSGGVDSMVLLDMLVHSRVPGFQIEKSQLVVAHVNHGIRTDSDEDELLVRAIAKKHDLTYEVERLHLGVRASEDTARQTRYNFLRRCCKKYQAQLITAHHQDDIYETMLINLIRGTGWRGLVSLESDKIPRPLLGTSKQQILAYAKEHNVIWREDSTNQDTQYLRNYVRLTLLPAMIKADPKALKKLETIHVKTGKLKKEIATELQKIIPPELPFTLPRYLLIMWPDLVACEVIYRCLTKTDSNWHPQLAQVRRVHQFIKVAQNNKTLEVSKGLAVQVVDGLVTFQSRG